MTDLRKTDVARRLDAFMRLHPGDLGPGESLKSACDVGPVTLLYVKQQPPWILTRFGLLGWAIHRSSEKRRAQARRETLMQSIAYAAQGAVTELPEAVRGCVLILTNQRVLVYDRKGKQKLTECPIEGLVVSANDHGLGKTSLVFSNGNERFVVAVNDGATEMGRHFLGARTTLGSQVVVF